MIYGYIRVSTDKQTVENQRYEIQQFCNSQELIVDRWIEETVTGKKDYKDRKFGKMLKKLKKDDTIICSELSRLGRGLEEVKKIIDE